MKIRMKHIFVWSFLFLLLLSSFSVRPVIADEAGTGPAGLSAEEALRLGEAMYLKGILPSGKPMEAVVQEDTILTGTMVTCANCHVRSGLGSFEGTVFTLPTNGGKLYAPLTSSRDIPGSGMARSQFRYPRPAYTDQSLARALRQGVDAGGRKMIESMPLYDIEDRDMEIMIFYLKNLSAKLSPGVTGGVVRFSTVVAGEVSPEDRAAMIEPLNAFIQAEWNPGVSTLAQATRDDAYRPLSLDVWELKGPSETWKDQLEALYKNQPVFGLLGGMSTGNWGPMHEFCEKNRVPCIFPITDLPQISETGWYTLYFSKGYYQEGEAAAKYLARVLALPPDREIIQVFRDNDRGKALSQGFSDVWKKLGEAVVKNRVLSSGEKTGEDFWESFSVQHRDAVVLLWLEPEDLAGFGTIGELKEKPSAVFVSWTMLSGSLAPLPDAVRDFTFITYPNRLPGEEKYASRIVEQWMKVRKISPGNVAITSKVFFLTRMVTRVLTNMRGDFYRDYFLDLFDMEEDRSDITAQFPRLSFGPGQRYASKGCYIMTPVKGKEEIVKASDWIIY